MQTTQAGHVQIYEYACSQLHRGENKKQHTGAVLKSERIFSNSRSQYLWWGYVCSEAATHKHRPSSRRTSKKLESKSFSVKRKPNHLYAEILLRTVQNDFSGKRKALAMYLRKRCHLSAAETIVINKSTIYCQGKQYFEEFPGGVSIATAATM